MILEQVHLWIEVPNALLGLLRHPLAIVLHVLRQPFGIVVIHALLHTRMRTGFPSLNFGGISIMALPIITATGFKSDP